MRRSRHLWRISLCLCVLPFFLVILSNCSGGSTQQSVSISSTPLPKTTSTISRLQTSTPTISPTFQKTRTASLSPSPFPTKTITPTPLPTFNPTEARAIVEEFFFGDASDILNLGPIEPGISTWGESQKFLKRFAVTVDPYSCCWIGAAIPIPPDVQTSSKHYKFFDIFLYMKRGLIPQATIDIIATRQYELLISDVLKRYGPPTYVYVFILDTLPINTYATYDLLLIYEEQGFLVSVGGKTSTGEWVSLCPDVKEIPQVGKLVIAGNLGEHVALEDLQAHDFLREFFKRPPPGFLQLEDVSEMNIEQFTEFFSTPGNLCFTIDNPTKPPKD